MQQARSVSIFSPPFISGFDGLPLARSSVEQRVVPGTLGVYALYKNPGRFPLWVFVGKGYVRAHLLAHLTGNPRYVAREGPTHFWFEPIPDFERVEERERELIRQLSPTCNVLVP
jgi:hypothetical protein